MTFAVTSGLHTAFGFGAPGEIDSLSQGGQTVTIPDAHLLFSGDYQRAGNDLIVSDDLHRVVVSNYFHGDKRPLLVSPEGAPLDSKVIEALTGHVQYAQAAPAAAAAKVVGHVVKMTGSASLVRNGVTIAVNNGDVVYQSDVVQTGSGSTLGLVMIDGTTFNLTANARLMLNDLTYDAGSTSNTALFTLVQGAANFVAGQVAKTGDMKVGTPVATMGIRGTAVILDISAVDGKVSISVVNQQDNQVHAVEVRDRNGNLIGTVTSNGSTLTLTPTATFEVIASYTNKTLLQVQEEFNAFQSLLSTYDIGKQLVPSTPAPTDGRRGDATPQTTTKFAGTTIAPVDSTATKFNDPVGSTTKPGTGIAATEQVKIELSNGDASGLKGFGTSSEVVVVKLDVPADPVPFVVTPSEISRVSSGPGDHFGPVMSADGRYVTYDPDGAIYLYDRQSNTTATIAAPGDGFIYGAPTISSDGRTVVYMGTKDGHSGIFIYNNDPASPNYQHTTQLMSGGVPVSGGVPAISGDGSTIVVETGGGIGVYDLQGHVLATITSEALGESGTLWRPAISADGHLIAFWVSNSATPGGAGHLVTYDLSTATFATIAATAADAGTAAASLSADGRYVVYQGENPGGHPEVFLYDLASKKIVFQTDNAAGSYNPVISPDGHFIVFATDAKLTSDDTNEVADTYVVDVTDPAHPLYRLVSVVGGTAGDAASDLGAAISAGGLFVAFGSKASNFSRGDSNGSGDIFVVDPSSGHSAIIEARAGSLSLLTASGTIALTGAHNGATLSVSDSSGRFTAAFDANGDIRWNFSEQKSDFAPLAPGQTSSQKFIVTLSNASGTSTTPVTVIVYNADHPAITPSDAAPVARPVALAPGHEDTAYTLTAAELLAKGVTDIDGPALSITAVTVRSGGGTIVDNHNGSWTYTPAPDASGPVVFDYTASDGKLTAGSTASLDIGSVNDAPAITSAAFAVAEGGAVVLTPASIGVTDPDSASFTFTVSNVTRGAFQSTADGILWIAATSFTTADLAAGHVRFLHDGGEDAPTFSIGADDGAGGLSDVVAGSVSFASVNDTPVVSSAALTIAEGGAAVLDPSDFAVTDPDNNSFVFTPSNLSHGAFQVTTDGTHWVPVATFGSADLNAGHVRFVHDGGEAAPTFSIRVDDGAGGLSEVFAGSVGFTNVNDAPVVTSAAIAVTEGGTAVVQAADIAVSDPDSSSFTFTVSNVGHGTFQTSFNGLSWAAATSFTTAELNAGHVRFVHDGGEAAPSFSIRADDGAGGLSNVVAGSVGFTNVNDAPVVTTAAIAVTEGGTAVVKAADIVVSDPDSSSFTFTVSNVSHGTFETSSNGLSWAAATSFTTAELNAGHVRFVHDGGEAAPSFSIRANDGAGGLSGVVAGSVGFTKVNDAPVVTGAAIAVTEGGTAVVKATDIAVSDPDSSSFSFTVSNVSHGAFETSSNGLSWAAATSFATAELNANHVRFVHDGGEDAPTFSIRADDGAGGLSNAVAGSVGFIKVNDAPAGSDKTVTTPEDTAYTFSAADFGFSDPDDVPPDSLLGVKIVSVSGAGSLTLNGVVVTAGQFVSVTEIGSGLLEFIPAADASGANYASFTFQVRDDGGTLHGGVEFDPSPNTITLDVTPVNDDPVAVTDIATSISQNGSVDVSFSPILNASAVGAGEYVITHAVNGQVGALWSDSKVSLNSSFTISAELFFGANDSGADGFSFIIQNHSKSTIGNAGGGLGYEGIAQSVAIEFDTFNNGSGANDIAHDHAAFDINGSMTGLGAPIDLGDIEDGQYHPVTIAWNAASHVITLSYNGAVIGTQTIDVAATVGANEAYIGFAGSTGALNNLQKIRNLNYQSADHSVVLDVVANDTDVDAGDKATLHVVSASSAGGATVTFSGAPGAGIVYSPGHAFDYLAAGATATDIVTYTIEDGHGGQSDPATAEVTITGLNDAPVFSGASAGAAFAANGSPVAVAVNVTAGDVDSDSYNGGSLTATVTNGGHQGDTLSIASTPFIWVSGNTVMFDSDGSGPAHAVALGTLTSNFNTLTVTLNNNAGDAAVKALAEAIAFRNTLSAPGSDTRTVTFTLKDGGGTADGGHDTAYFEATVAVDPGPSTLDVTVSGTEDVSKAFSLASSGPAARGFVLDSAPAASIGAIHYVDASGQSGIVAAGLEYGIDAAFTFVPANDWNGSALFQYHAVGTSGVADPVPNDLTFGFAAVNDAPVAGGAATLAAIDEDNIAAPGATVANLFGPAFSDAADDQTAGGGSHADAFAGIAISDYMPDATKGVWQYAAAGSSWVVLGAANATAAITLSAGASLRFVPAHDYNGAATALAANLIETGATIVDGAIVDLVASGTGGSTHVSAGTVALGQTIKPVDDAPVIIGGDQVSLSVDENTTGVTIVAADDVDGPSLAWSVITGSGSPDAAKFTIGATTGALTFRSAPDFGNPADSNHNNIYTVQVRVSDGTLSDTQTLFVRVVDVNDNAPVITTGSFQSVAENHAFVTRLSAFDVDSVGGPTSFTIAAGLDGNLFEIVNGNLQFRTAPDFEHPLDSNHNNIYSVTVNAYDGVNSSSKTIAVQVSNVNEAPVLAPDSGAVTYTENAAALALMSGGSVADPDNPSNFDDGSLSVTLNGAAPGDELVLASVGGVSISGSSVKVGGVTVGTISGNHSTQLSVDFNSSATDARVETVLHALAFDSTSDNPGHADRTATVTFNDGSNDGSGPALSDSSTVTIHVAPVNDAPHAVDDSVITNNAGNSTYAIPEWVLLANDTDPDSAVLDVTALSSAAGFSVNLNTSPGKVTIIDNSSVGGSFNYTASDGSLTDNAHVTVTQDTGTMNGGSGSEIFIGDSSGSTINANAGNDVLIGNGGDDTLDGGPGNDIYVFGLADGRDTIAHSSGVDAIRIEAGGAALTGLGFAEDTHDNLVIQFNGQQITVVDQFDDSTVGALQFAGGASYDGYDLGGDAYSVSGDSGTSRSGTSGNDILAGDAAGNTISGGDGKDLLFGNGGNDTLNGGAGNDLLVGGGGNDAISGGSGNDVFVFAAGSGRDIIADFTPGQDKISLDFHAFNTGAFDSWLNGHALSVNGGHDVLIDLSADGHSAVDTILLQNVAAVANLHAGDFIVR